MFDFPLVQKAIEQGIERQLHSCVQIYVSLRGQVVLDEGFGQATKTTACDQNTLMLWRSAGKPLTAAAICRAGEHEQLSIDSRLGDLLEEAGEPLRTITIRQLLTHESGLPLIDTGWPHSRWEASLQKILSIDSRTSHAAYQPQSAWFLLGEILQRLDSGRRPFAEILEQDLLQPLGMQRTYCGIAAVDSESLPLPDYFVRERGQLVLSEYGKEPWLTQPSPGGNLRGPVSELGRFYEMMLARGLAFDGKRFLAEPTVAAMTTAHRLSRFDETLQHVVDMGLGFLIDSNRHGASTVPYGFSKYCSPQTFGHGGSQCAIGFCDPVHELVVAWAANGFCGEGQHQRRNRAINEAIYQDLRLNPSRDIPR